MLSSALGDRTITADLDCFIDPPGYGVLRSQVQAEVRHLITKVVETMHFVRDWANDQVRLFLTFCAIQKISDRSLRQGLLLYNGTNFEIYAVLWLWVLIRKIKSLQMEGQEPTEADWSDCVYILRRIVEDTGRPLRKTSLTEFDHTERESPVFSDTIDAVNHRYWQAFGDYGFAD